MNDAANDMDRVLADYRAFLGAFRSAVLATVDADGRPEASYAPFVRDAEGCFFVYLSDLARHTDHVRATGRVSLMLIENEEQAAQIYARTRIVLECHAEQLHRSDPLWAELMTPFQARFGSIIETLQALSDFHVFRLRPSEGVFVQGFGRAYRVSGAHMDQLEHIRRT